MRKLARGKRSLSGGSCTLCGGSVARHTCWRRRNKLHTSEVNKRSVEPSTCRQRLRSSANRPAACASSSRLQAVGLWRLLPTAVARHTSELGKQTQRRAVDLPPALELERAQTVLPCVQALPRCRRSLCGGSWRRPSLVSRPSSASKRSVEPSTCRQRSSSSANRLPRVQGCKLLPGASGRSAADPADGRLSTTIRPSELGQQTRSGPAALSARAKPSTRVHAVARLSRGCKALALRRLLPTAVARQPSVRPSSASKRSCRGQRSR